MSGVSQADYRFSQIPINSWTSNSGARVCNLYLPRNANKPKKFSTNWSDLFYYLKNGKKDSPCSNKHFPTSKNVFRCQFFNVFRQQLKARDRLNSTWVWRHSLLVALQLAGRIYRSFGTITLWNKTVEAIMQIISHNHNCYNLILIIKRELDATTIDPMY